jgi:hypothetical protein
LDRRAAVQETSRGVRISKTILGLSFVLPYLVDWMDADDFRHLLIYAPTWLVLDSEQVSYVGPTLMTFLMIFYWLPYVYVGYQSYRFAKGKYSGVGRYVAGVVFVTLVAVLLTIPMMIYPRAVSDETVFYPAVIPLPLVSVLALALVPLLRPFALTSPWDSVKEDVFSDDHSVDAGQRIG